MPDGTSAAGPRKRTRKAPAITTPDPIEIAMEATASGRAPGGEASALLRDQRRLIGWEIADRRAAFGMRLLLIAAGFAVAAVAGVMVWRASQARGLVIEAFEVPPSLAGRGLSGKVLATQVQDRVERMQAETASPLAVREVSNRWEGDVKVEIASTGVSLAEVDGLLRQWLGDEMRVSGEAFAVTRPDGAPGLALVVRTTAGWGAKAEGTEAGLDALIEAAAETVMRQTQPQRYADWLLQHGREAEAVALSRWLAVHGAGPDRAMALLRLSRMDPSPPMRLLNAYIAPARAADPANSRVWDFLGGAAFAAGRWEDALAYSKKAEEIGRRSRRLSAAGRGLTVHTQRSNREGWLGAYLDSLADAERQRQFEQADLDAAASRLIDAELTAAGHDVAGSRAIVAATPPPSNPAQPVRLAYARQLAVVSAAQFAAMEDWAGLFALQSASEAQRLQLRENAKFLQYKAQALAGLGRHSEARAVIGATALDCYPCLVMRGSISRQAGDTAGAERWYRTADSVAPSFPQAPEQWGRLLLASGQVDAAIGKAREAHRRSPRYGDPLELLGEALLAKGQATAAEARFAAAAQFTPRWGRLHLKWGEALAAQGKADEARAKWRAAAGMDLTAGERARLQTLLQRRTI